jgi:hypothetical protein
MYVRISGASAMKSWLSAVIALRANAACSSARAALLGARAPRVVHLELLREVDQHALERAIPDHDVTRLNELPLRRSNERILRGASPHATQKGGAHCGSNAKERRSRAKRPPGGVFGGGAPIVTA